MTIIRTNTRHIPFTNKQLMLARKKSLQWLRAHGVWDGSDFFVIDEHQFMDDRQER